MSPSNYGKRRSSDPSTLSLTDLPPEVLLRITSDLTLRPLIAFSSTCRHFRVLSARSLHSLTFAIYENRVALKIGSIADLASFTKWQPMRSKSVVQDGNSATVVLPQESKMDALTMLAFHDALHCSILGRYAAGLRVLELSLWDLTRPVANVLRSLAGLHSLTLGIRYFYGRTLTSVASQAEDEARRRTEAWSRLASAWPKLEVLRLDAAVSNMEELVAAVQQHTKIEDLRLKRCKLPLNEVMEMLAAWSGRRKLRYLCLHDCGMVNGEDLSSLHTLSVLEHLSFDRCTCIDPSLFNSITKDMPHVNTYEPPRGHLELLLRNEDEDYEIDSDSEYGNDFDFPGPGRGGWAYTSGLSYDHR